MLQARRPPARPASPRYAAVEDAGAGDAEPAGESFRPVFPDREAITQCLAP